MPAIWASAGCITRWDEDSVNHMNHMINYVDTEISSCTAYPCNGTNLNQHSKLSLSPRADPLEFVFVDILRPLPRTEAGLHLLFIMIYRYTKLARAIPTKNVTPIHVSTTFFNNWVISYRITDNVLTDNGQQFNRKFFISLCSYLKTNKRTKAAFHLLTNDQVES